MQNKILYLSYNGLLEPLGQSQIIPYIEILSKFSDISIISIESDKSLFYKLENKINKNFDNEKILWKFYKRNNFSKIKNLFLIIQIIFSSIFIMYKKKINIIHARSYIPGFIGLILKKINSNIKLIYDIRGFWVDEKTDRLNFSKKFLYKLFVFIDKSIYKNSDKIICLTSESKEILKKKFNFLDQLNIFVMPTCGNHNNFFPIKQKKINQIKFCYVGSINGAYDFQRVAAFIKKIINTQNENFFFSIINTSQHEEISSIMHKLNFPLHMYEILELDIPQINEKINSSDIGCFYANDNYSIKASFPTRISEFLLCGKPILCNPFNKDILELINNNEVGIISDFNLNKESLYYSNIIRFIKKSRENNNKIRNIAMKRLSLNFAENTLNIIYSSLT